MKAPLVSIGWRLLPGGLAALIVAGLLKLGAWQPLEQAAYNALFNARGEIAWDQRVVIIAIDEASLKQLGRFPLPRNYYTQLLKILTPAEPSVVVLDLLFSEPSPDDAGLADAIAQQGRVVLAQAWDSHGQSLLPVAALRANAISTGHVLNRPDTDGITRQVEPEIQDIPYLGIAAIQAYSLVQQPITLPKPSQLTRVNWIGSTRHAPQYSLVDVIQSKVAVQTFRDKIVVVGVTADGLDSLFTPFDRNPPASGVHLSATVISNLLQRRFLQVVDTNWLVLILLVGGPSFSLVLKYWGWGRRLLVLISSCLAWGLISLLCFQSGYWTPVAAPIILFCLSTALVEVWERLQINAQLRQDIQRIWQTYYRDLLFNLHSPQWVNQSAAEPHLSSATSSRHRNLPAIAIQPIAQLAELAEQFARSQSAHAAIARSLSIGLLAADWDGYVWFCNPVAADWLEIRVGERLQARLVPHWLSQADWQADLLILQNGWIAYRELQRGEQWFEVKLEPLFYHPPLAEQPEDADPPPTGIMLLLEDITPRKQAEVEIHKALQREKELNQLKSRFVAMISHEFRTPLTTIQSATELLEHYQWSAEERQERFQQIHSAIQHMTQLLEDVLLIGRVEAGKQPFRPEQIDLAEFCRTLITDLQLTAGASHQFLFTIQGTVQPAWIDTKLLRQILTNLLSNAVKYSPNGGDIWLELNYHPETVVLQVRDQGICIPPADQEHLFEAFHRAGNVDTIQGTGLGLAIVKRCVELHQGQIWFESELSTGTTFTVALPLKNPHV